jgi:hypothetical protein
MQMRMATKGARWPGVMWLGLMAATLCAMIYSCAVRCVSAHAAAGALWVGVVAALVSCVACGQCRGEKQHRDPRASTNMLPGRLRLRPWPFQFSSLHLQLPSLSILSKTSWNHYHYWQHAQTAVAWRG